MKVELAPKSDFFRGLTFMLIMMVCFHGVSFWTAMAYYVIFVVLQHLVTEMHAGIEHGKQNGF